MASIALVAVGGLIGSSVLGSVVGVAIGTMIGQAVGGLIGGYIDQYLFASSGQNPTQDGTKLSDLKVTGSTEGASIPRLYGRARLSGQVIWATNLEEVAVTSDSSGGKGGGSSGNGSTTYKYYANFAVGICEGVITSIGRIWADGKEIDVTDYTYRIYKGTETQTVDSLISAKEGAGKSPAYRGLAYIVFERLPLEKFGNRIPNLNFEVFKSVDGFENIIKAITILPGSGEFVYAQQKIERSTPGGLQSRTAENLHTRKGPTDWEASIDDLEDTFSNLQNTALIVSWFGTDLRCENCDIVPKVENNTKVTSPISWSVAGYTRSTAPVVSLHDGNSAFGGTPSDETVIGAIQNLNSRGFNVTFYPFLMMDIPTGNSLSDPYSVSGVGQSVYPWRGRITLSKAPGIAGSPDQTATAVTQLNTFIPKFRAFILHYANLCATAGGVDTFYIATELVQLNRIRGPGNSFPFVSALVALAADVKAILPSAKITYGADWSEYFGYSTGSSGELFFHLDPLWSSSNISAIAIDCYWPLSDWRNNNTHLDKLAGTKSIYDLSYLKSNIQGGEGYSWYYANQSDRDNQVRTPITDGAYGKPWVWRYKDVKSWWLNQHYNRPAGVQSGSPTAWVPQSKPIWFSELGCPAVDLGSNQPNVFYDPKSSESFFPYYSSGVRDDFIQRRHIQAFIEYWDHTNPLYVSDANPVSSVYGGRMVDLSRIYVYTWDARPYPAFPYDSAGWSDRSNWQYGHWLVGRISGGALDGVMTSMFNDYGFTDFDVSTLVGQMDGYVIDRIMSLRDACSPLGVAFFFDSFESDGIIKFRHRGYLGSQIILNENNLVDKSDGTINKLFEITRGQETDLPLAAKISYYDGQTDYRQATVESRRLTVRSDRVSIAQFPIISRSSLMQSVADILLQENWVSREKGKCSIPPSMTFIEPTDLITLAVQGREYTFRVIGIQDNIERELDLMLIDRTIYSHSKGVDRRSTLPPYISYSSPNTMFMDLPLIHDTDNPNSGYIGSYLNPWPGAITIYRSALDSGYTPNTVLELPMSFGKTLNTLPHNISNVFDYSNELLVEVIDGTTLSSISEIELFEGKNLCALKNSTGGYELLQFQNASLIATRQYKLTKLLRGQFGSNNEIETLLASGSDFVVLNGAIEQVKMYRSEVGLSYYWKDGPYNRSIADSSYNTRQLAYKGVGLKPYSPCNLRLNKVGANLIISWVRRTRIGGDNWEVTEVPLSEEYEKYRLEIYNGITIVRVIETVVPSYTYTSAQYTADFGSQPISLKVSVSQLSPYGLGNKSTKTLLIRSVS